MPSSSYAQLRGEIREDFRDELETMFTDDELDGFIDEAQREYCLLTGCLCGEKEAVAGFIGEPLSAPSDFFRPVSFTDVDGVVVPEIGWRELSQVMDFRAQVGSAPRFVCYDFDTWGKYRVFPNCHDIGEVVGTLRYKRFPAKGILEIRDHDALRDYSLYLAFLHAGKDQYSMYLSQFNSAMNESRSMRESFYARPQTRTGVFF